MNNRKKYGCILAYVNALVDSGGISAGCFSDGFRDYIYKFHLDLNFRRLGWEPLSLSICGVGVFLKPSARQSCISWCPK